MPDQLAAAIARGAAPTPWVQPVSGPLGLAADERGASTAEYAIVTLAAVAFAGLLVAVLRSDEVRGMLGDIVRRALTSA